MANGKVTTGFSYPFVAKYSASGTTVTYSSGQALARGVDVTLSPESSSDNIFYADNREAENAGSKITGYTLTLTVDGLHEGAERLITGLPAAVNDWIAVGGDSQEVPYLGVGWITRYMEDGVTSFVPTVCSKVRFSAIEKAAATQEEDIDWQTQSLEARGFRSDSAEHEFYQFGKSFTVSTTYVDEEAAEAAALTALKAKLGIS
jgi:hypothetical protein